jgi:hypothetical protein
MLLVIAAPPQERAVPRSQWRGASSSCHSRILRSRRNAACSQLHIAVAAQIPPQAEQTKSASGGEHVGRTRVSIPDEQNVRRRSGCGPA